jgi:hypothetical protein
LLDKPKLKARPTKETAPDIIAGQGQPSLHRFLLKVDGQIKASFETRDAAEKAGLTIKQAYPVVQASVYDTTTGSQAIIPAKKVQDGVG